MRYFTADLHLRHPFVAATRGYIDMRYHTNDMNAFRHNITAEAFESLCRTEKHDADLLKRFNARIGKQDELYILGDLACSQKDIEYVEHWLSQLYVPPARRHLILGNHEPFKPSIASREMFARQFATVSLIEVLPDHDFDEYNLVIMSHLPDKSKMNSQKIDDKYAPANIKGALYLHGHTHASTPHELSSVTTNACSNVFTFCTSCRNSVNIGLDAWRLKPVSEKQIKELLEKDCPYSTTTNRR